jgi:hypothetical protein
MVGSPGAILASACERRAFLLSHLPPKYLEQDGGLSPMQAVDEPLRDGSVTR